MTEGVEHQLQPGVFVAAGLAPHSPTWRSPGGERAAGLGRRFLLYDLPSLKVTAMQPPWPCRRCRLCGSCGRPCLPRRHALQYRGSQRSCARRHRHSLRRCHRLRRGCFRWCPCLRRLSGSECRCIWLKRTDLTAGAPVPLPLLRMLLPPPPGTRKVSTFAWWTGMEVQET